MEHLIDKGLPNSNGNGDISTSRNIYFPKENDIEIFEEYFKNTFNTKMQYVIKNEYIYILNSKFENNEEKISSENFNPQNYEFSEGDYRMHIKYVK